MQVEKMVPQFEQQEIATPVEPVIQDEILETPEPILEEPSATVIPPGSKTPSALLLKSLNEERAKRREAEAALQALQETPQPSYNSDIVFSDEGKALQAEILELKRE